MSKVFFIADTHFGDESILRCENRPFDSVEEMDTYIIEQWNSTVAPDDVVWHLGDIGDMSPIAEGRLNGAKFLVRGNHENESNGFYRDVGFVEVYDHPILWHRYWLLSHAPVYVNTNMPYANIFGHVHGNPIYKDYSKQHFCCCAERVGYKPISHEDIWAVVRGKPYVAPKDPMRGDNHGDENGLI